MIEFHAEQWLDTVGGVNRVAICAAPVELPRNGAVEEIKRRGFTIDGQSYELLGVGCHMPATPIHPGEHIELLVAGGPKRAEPNEHAKRLRSLPCNYQWEVKVLEAAAGEIERLELVVERLWARRERDWLPIESAPRDGTRVELWCEHDVHRIADDRQEFSCYGRYNLKSRGDWDDWIDDYGRGLAATHWRPEPSGPSKPDQETKVET